MNNKAIVITLIATLLISILLLSCEKEDIEVKQLCDCYTFSDYGRDQLVKTFRDSNCENINRAEVLDIYKEFINYDAPGTTYPLNIKYENVNCR